MRAVAKPTGHAFDLLDLGVDCFPQRIGDPMLGVSHNVIDMGLECLRRFLDRPQPRMRGPEIPAFEIVAHRRLVPVIPQMPKVLLDRPSSADLQILSPEGGKLLLPPRRHVLLTPQPQILGALQRRLTGIRKLAVLAFADLVDRIQYVAHHMKAVKDNFLLCIRHMLLSGRNERIPHVHGHRLNPGHSSRLNCR